MKYLNFLILTTSFFLNFSLLSAQLDKGDVLLSKVSKLVQSYFPEAAISQDNRKFVAKHNTMTFTVHQGYKTGEFSEQTYQIEGPNFKGFIISISIQDGENISQAIIPQTLNDRYWMTYIDRPSTDDGKGHYVINFSYGSRLDNEFKNSFFELLKKLSPFNTN